MTNDIDRVVEKVVSDLLASDPHYASAKELYRLAVRDALRSGLPELAQREKEKFCELVRRLLRGDQSQVP